MVNETTNGAADEQSSDLLALSFFFDDSGDPREKETSQSARDTDVCSIPVNSFLPNMTDAATDPSSNFLAW